MKIRGFSVLVLVSVFHLVSCNGQEELDKDKIIKLYRENNNNIIEEYVSFNDTVVRAMKFYESGVINFLAYYNFDGQPHGVSYEWNENGDIRIKWNFYNGELHGEASKWHDNNKLWSRAKYIHGNLEGEKIVLNEKGDTSCYELYDNGFQLSRFVTDEYYTPHEGFIESLIEQGLDSMDAVNHLKSYENYSGWVEKTDSGGVFVHDDSVYEIIQDIKKQIGSSFYDDESVYFKSGFEPINAIDFMRSKGISDENIKLLFEGGYVKSNRFLYVPNDYKSILIEY